MTTASPANEHRVAFTGVLLPDDSASVGHSELTSLRNHPTPHRHFTEQAHLQVGNVPSMSGPPLANLEASASVAAVNHAYGAHDNIQRSLFTFEQLTSEGEDHDRGGSDEEDGDVNAQNTSLLGTAEVQIDPTTMTSFPDIGAAAGESMLSSLHEAGIEHGMTGEEMRPVCEAAPEATQGLCEVAMPSEVGTSVEEGTVFDNEHIRGGAVQGGTSTMESRVSKGLQESEVEGQGAYSGSEKSSQPRGVPQSRCSDVEQHISSSGSSGASNRGPVDSGTLPVLH
jgi:hypothetical protein